MKSLAGDAHGEVVATNLRPRQSGPRSTIRVAVVHNRYRSSMPSGENQVVDDDVRNLIDAGLDVETFFRDSDSIQDRGFVGKASLAASPTYARTAVRDFTKMVAAFQPDLVHLHNPVPLISPWVVRVAKRAGVPVVQTVHNYRHSCPASTSFFRSGSVCEDCAGKIFPWPGVLHGCYHGSRPESLSMAVSAAVHHSTWQMVDRFLPVSAFVGEKLVQAGIAPSRITIRPNSTRDWGAINGPGSGFVFIGRLTNEKGISLLLEAWAQSSLWKTERLIVVGDGPERHLLTGMAGRNVDYRGALDAEGVREAINEAAVVVVPSRCFEGFPRVIAEAFERGRPVAATALGALPEWVAPDVGWTASADPSEFAAMLTHAASDSTLGRKSARARQIYESKLTPFRTTATLLDVYESLVSGMVQSASSARGVVR